MIEFENFCILHMPRCGGSFIGASKGATRRTPGHEGWSYFKPFNKDVYGLIREPSSWYLSLHAYSIKKNLVWKSAFGINDNDDIETAMCKWITGSHAIDDVIEVPQMKPQNISRQLRDMGIGLWSWWVLHMYGVNGGADKHEELAEDVGLLWLNKRQEDLVMLESKYDQKLTDPTIQHARNTSKHDDPKNVFSNISATLSLDAPILTRAMSRSSTL